MKLNYNFSFMDCQGCHARINCDKCEEKIKSALLQYCMIERADISMTAKRISIETSCTDENLILDAMEELGLFEN